MSESLACTQDERDALASAIKSGALRVRHADGRMIEYQSRQDMTDTLDAMDRHLGTLPTSASSAASRHSRASFSRE